MNGANKLRLAPFWWVAGIVLALVVVFESLAPTVSMPPLGNDKLAHFAGYGVLSFWFAGILQRRRYPVLAALLLAFGVLVELAQYAMGLGRTADWRDVVANSLGIATALALAYAGLGMWMVQVERRLGLS
ncbi:MAG: VanZ family protein [Gammaproteobacteria bacterium]